MIPSNIRCGLRVCVPFVVLVLYACGGGDGGFKVVSISPDNGLANVQIDSVLIAEFSKDIDQTSLTPSTFWLVNEHNHQKVKSQIDYDANTKTATLKPAKLLYDTHYTVTLHHSILDLDGNHLSEEAQESSFFTIARPPLFKQQPQPGADGVSIQSVVQVDFERPPTASTVNTQTFTVSSSGVLISGIVEITDSTATFTPQANLLPGTRYDVTLSEAITDSTGASMFGAGFAVNWSFTTTQTPSSTLHIGSDKSDSIESAVLTNDGAIIIGGSTEGVFGADTNKGMADAYLSKLNPDGTSVWSTMIGTTQFDTITDLSVLSTGNIAAVGHADNFYGVLTEGNADIFVASFDTSGTLLWQENLGSPDNHDMSTGVVVDTANNIFVAGSSMGSIAGNTNQGMHDVVLAKFTEAGTREWVHQYGTAGDELAKAVGFFNNTIYIFVEQNEAIEMAPPAAGMGGPIGPPPIFHPTAELAIYQIAAADGSQISQQIIDKGVTRFIMDAVVSDTGDSYITGLKPPTGFNSNGYSAFVLKILASGEQAWEDTWSNEGPIESNALFLDTDQNVYTAGMSFVDNFRILPTEPMLQPPQLDFKLNLRKTSATGQMVWSKDISASDHSLFSKIIKGSDGNFVALGNTHGGVDGNISKGNQDGFLVKFDASGNIK